MIRPILFNTEMVTAILDGRKTATRRLIKPQPKENMKYKLGYLIMGGSKKDIGKFGFGTLEWGGRTSYARPPALVGDILYVRETWNTSCSNCEHYECPAPCSAPRYMYRADCPDTEDKWKPSIHMPKEAARIWLKVTAVRPERLQDMTLDDFLNEGITVPYEASNDPGNAYMQAKSLFTDVWNATVNKKEHEFYGWDANPWVWAIEFERIEKPEGWCV